MYTNRCLLILLLSSKLNVRLPLAYWKHQGTAKMLSKLGNVSVWTAIKKKAHSTCSAHNSTECSMENILLYSLPGLKTTLSTTQSFCNCKPQQLQLFTAIDQLINYQHVNFVLDFTRKFSFS